jgi:hypothetical protein
MKKSSDGKSSAHEAQSTKRMAHSSGKTNRPETPELEGRTPLPEEVTGRASGTDDDLVVLFNEKNSEQLADGFRGGSDDEPPADDEGSNTKHPSKVGPA